jgi:hypothetical protein
MPMDHWLSLLKGHDPGQDRAVPVDRWPGRPEGHCLVEIVQACAGLRGTAPWRLCGACGSLAWQAFVAWPDGVELVQACAGLRHVALVWLRSGPKDWRSHGLHSNGPVGL